MSEHTIQRLADQKIKCK